MSSQNLDSHKPVFLEWRQISGNNLAFFRTAAGKEHREHEKSVRAIAEGSEPLALSTRDMGLQKGHFTTAMAIGP